MPSFARVVASIHSGQTPDLKSPAPSTLAVAAAVAAAASKQELQPPPAMMVLALAWVQEQLPETAAAAVTVAALASAAVAVPASPSQTQASCPNHYSRLTEALRTLAVLWQSWSEAAAAQVVEHRAQLVMPERLLVQARRVVG
jgi:hypothetical protein